jgi:arsenate reductase
VRHDKRFAELGLEADDYTDAAPVIDLLLAHPELMQRPVLLAGDRGAIGRPPEQALELL